MMNFIRLSTWKNKLAPFLCLIYAFFYKTPHIVLENQAKTIFFLLTGIVLIAIWASLVNNYYDIDDDTKVGKPNGMAKISPFLRKLSLVFCQILGLFFCSFLLPNKLPILFYGLSWLCFYLYSSAAIRLKEKPFFDLLTDGLASQLFPSLYIFAYLFEGNFQGNYTFVISGSLWLFFSMGVRALIMHQYRDEEKDQQVGLNTYVLGSKAVARKNTERFLLVFEIAFFTVFAFSIHWIAFILPMFLYGVLFLIFKKSFANIKIVYFNLNVTAKHRIFLYDAYTLFTFCLLGLLCWKNLQNSVFVVFHLLLFHVAILSKMWKFLKQAQ
jgi:hypothetical protein